MRCRPASPDAVNNRNDPVTVGEYPSGAPDGAQAAPPTLDGVRLTEFWARMEERFGAAYARSFAADYRLSVLGATVDEALARGEEARTVWRAVCTEVDVPGHLH